MERIKSIHLTIVLIFTANLIIIFFHSQLQLIDALENLRQYWHNYLFNGILLYLLYVLFLVIFNRKMLAWFAFFSTIILFSIANFLKLSYRSEPLLPSDFSMIFQLQQILQLINFGHMLISIVLIGVLLALLIYLIKLKEKRVFKSKIRLFIGFILFLFIVCIFYSKHPNNPYTLVSNAFGISDTYWDMTDDYSQNGPVAGFLKNIDVVVMEDEPEGYSIEAISAIVEKYKEKALEHNSDLATLEDHTVIYILSESFMDPLRIPNLELSADPIPYIRYLMEETTSGLILGSNFGGGTANVEYEILTSISMNDFDSSLRIPYTLLVPNLQRVPNITNLFDHRIAIHSYNANLYRRKEVFDKFGFDLFIHEGGTPDLTYKETLDGGSYISDESAYQEVLDYLLDEDLTGDTFILLTTMQNHGPYSANQYETEIEVLNDMDENEKSKIQTYVHGVNATDLATEQFINQINEIDKPVTIVFFGDHMPSDVFDPLSENNEEDLNFYETEYFIYSNFETEKLNYPVISPYTMSSILFEHLNVAVTPYYELISELKETVPAIRWGEYYLQQNQTAIYWELPEDILEIVDDYRMIQYDINVGAQYSIDLGMFDYTK
ncbi:LTA synthase family protein [Ureibacillus manganicus]|uniref:Sulfatase N-terminal domain-containing protein n=1 Tax=Ureibacillus manganicus DSM 26584 TaxID=1384049 RepID=A0A0A3ISE0_9BACL|nr:LTA synthase family protein [Ureibacillus manganicus]KGR77747.1 hypothetical protein CD29_13945 [Ureibacillus manganicus DSM 26584]